MYEQPSPTFQYDAVSLSVSGPCVGSTSSQGPVQVGSGSALAIGDTAVARISAATAAIAITPADLARPTTFLPDDGRSPPIGCVAPPSVPAREAPAREAVFARPRWLSSVPLDGASRRPPRATIATMKLRMPRVGDEYTTGTFRDGIVMIVVIMTAITAIWLA